MDWRIERFGFIVEKDGEFKKMTRKRLRITNIDKFIDEFRFMKHQGWISATWVINGREEKYGRLSEKDFRDLLEKINCPEAFWAFIN